MAKLYTFDENLISDLHKETYGFRPSERLWEEWNSFNNDEKQEYWNALLEAHEREVREEAERESCAIYELSKKVHEIILDGAMSEEQAILWLMESVGCENDPELACYELGLPFSMTSVFEKAMKA